MCAIRKIWPAVIIIAALSYFTNILHGQHQPVSLDPSNDLVIIQAVRLNGNKITRDKIIYREMMFNPGDTVPVGNLDSLIARTEENLMNTSLFNFVETGIIIGKDSAHVIVSFHFTERWYIWPVPILKISDRNFNIWWEAKELSHLSYGFYVNWRNFSGNKDNLTTTLQFGFDRLFSVQYDIPYLNTRQTLGMGFGAGRWRQKETALITEDNRQQFYQDPETFAREDLFAFGQFLFRPGIYNSHLTEIRYDYHHFSDSLLAQNEYYSVEDYSNVQYFSFRYLFKSDHRDYKQYPLKGYYFDIEAVKYGLGVFKEPAMNTFRLRATFRKFWELQPRLFFATGINGMASTGDNQPYFLLQGIGYGRDIVRAYEYYVVDARHFVILKNNLKYALIPQREDRVRFISSEKFGRIFYALYLNVFLDAGYGYFEKELARESNDLQNSLLLGYGTGIDFTTYYDIVVRLEFSMNLMNEPGIYLHFMAPI